jgi:hypothetical protein
MKSIKRNLKWAAIILAILFLLQSCTIYHGYTSSADEAVGTSLKVKIKIPDEDPYVYKRLKRIDGEVYGLARPKSSTARRLQDQVVDQAYDGKFALIELNETELDHIHMMNQKATYTTMIVVDLVLLTLLLIPWS